MLFDTGVATVVPDGVGDPAAVASDAVPGDTVVPDPTVLVTDVCPATCDVVTEPVTARVGVIVVVSVFT